MKKFYYVLVHIFWVLIIIANAGVGLSISNSYFGENPILVLLFFILDLLVGFLIATLTCALIFTFFSMHTHLQKMDATLSEIKKNLEPQTNQSEKNLESSENSVQKENSNS